MFHNGVIVNNKESPIKTIPGIKMKILRPMSDLVDNETTDTSSDKKDHKGHHKKDHKKDHKGDHKKDHKKHHKKDHKGDHKAALNSNVSTSSTSISTSAYTSNVSIQGGTIQVTPSGNVGDLRYPKTLPPLPKTATPPSGSVVGDSLSKFQYIESTVTPPGAAPNINTITQVAPGISMHGLRFRGKWNDGDRNVHTGYHSYKARAEIHGLGGKTPYEMGSTYLIGTTVYLAPDFEPSEMYTDLMQPIHFQSYFNLTGSGDNITGSLMVFTKGLGSAAKSARSVKIPRGQWVSLVLKIKLGTDGYYGLSVNGDNFQGINLDTTIGKVSATGVGKGSAYDGTFGLYMTNKGPKTDAVVFHAYPFFKKIA